MLASSIEAKVLWNVFVDFIDPQYSGLSSGSNWTYEDCPTFNFAFWMAWAPITALFLGKIAIGRND